jgi:phage shock protein A
MGIFQRISTLLKSNINDLISRAENPEKVLNQSIDDMRSQLGKAKQEVAGAIADARKLQQQLEKEKKQAEEWEQRAMLAVQEGRDDLAKQALMRHSEHLQHAQAMHETWVRQKAETEQLKNALRQLNDKIEEAKRKRNILVARQKRAEAQGRIQETMSAMSNKSAFENFERMTEKIEETERKALAAAELSEDLTGDMLQQEFDALEYHGSSDQQLLELKKKMGMLSAGEAGERPQLGAGDGDDVADAEVVEETPAEDVEQSEGEQEPVDG